MDASQKMAVKQNSIKLLLHIGIKILSHLSTALSSSGVMLRLVLGRSW